MRKRFTPQYEEMIVRWASLVSAQRHVLSGPSETFRVVEIGVGTGFTSNLLVSDLVERDIDYEYFGIDNRSYPEAQEIFFNHENMSLIEGVSWELADGIPSPIHFLFIDGDHVEESVRKDVAAYADKVPVGGVVAFHDVAHTGAGVVLRELVKTGQWSLMLYSHEPASIHGQTPGIAVVERVKE